MPLTEDSSNHYRMQNWNGEVKLVEASQQLPIGSELIDPPTATKVLTCPVRGPLNSLALAKDNLTVTEEARRIDLINFLISKGYPTSHIDIETVVIKNLGEKGRNKVRSDLIVYDQPASHLASVALTDKLGHAQIIAEVKRESKSKKSGIDHQLDPALRVLPAVSALGIYWDDIQQILLVKSVKGKNSTQHIGQLYT